MTPNSSNEKVRSAWCPKTCSDRSNSASRSGSSDSFQIFVRRNVTILKFPVLATDLPPVILLAVRWVIRPGFQLLRWFLIIGLWLATLATLVLGLAALARIFTGDPEFGALDGVQFTESLYQAVFRFILAAVLVFLLQRTLGWRPAAHLTAMLEPAHRDRALASDRHGRDDPDSGADRAPGPQPVKTSKPQEMKGRPRAWAVD